MKTDLPQLQSVIIGDWAFDEARQFEMIKLPSLQTIVFGWGSFNYAGSLSLRGTNEWLKWRIDFPQLQSVKVGDDAFEHGNTFEMINLPSLSSIELGKGIINGASSYSFIGMIEWMKRSIDLPQLKSTKLGSFQGDSSRKMIDEYPFNYNNTLIMKSWVDGTSEYNRSSITWVIWGICRLWL